MSHKTGKILNCFFCNIKIYVPGWKLIKNKNFFCSKKCHYKQQSINNIGKNNLMFKYKINFKKENNPFFGKKHTNETKIILSNKAKTRPPTTLGRIRPCRERIRQSIIMKERLKNKENHPSWKGGITSIKRPRKTREYKNFRESVFNRDDFTCYICGIKGGYLEVHHILSWKNFPDLRYKINNGITVHKNCHPNRSKKWSIQKEKEILEKENLQKLLIKYLMLNMQGRQTQVV